MGSREQMALRIVLWLVHRYLAKRYRLMTPQELNQVVEDYLAELPKLGISLKLDRKTEGVGSDEVTTEGSSVFKTGKPQRRRRKPAANLEG